MSTRLVTGAGGRTGQEAKAVEAGLFGVEFLFLLWTGTNGENYKVAKYKLLHQ